MVSPFVQVIVVHTICNWIRISYFAALLATNLSHQFCLPENAARYFIICLRVSIQSRSKLRFWTEFQNTNCPCFAVLSELKFLPFTLYKHSMLCLGSIGDPYSSVI